MKKKFKSIDKKFKILYKTRTNIWGLLNFRKKAKNKKWRTVFLQTKLKKKKRLLSKPLKKIFFFKGMFRYKLQEKQKLKLFFGNIPNKRLKYIHKLSKLKGSDNFNNNFINLIESNLNSIIYRSNILSNIFNINKLIKSKKVSVNNNICINIYKKIKRGDIIRLHLTIKEKYKLLNIYSKTFRDHFFIDRNILGLKFNPKYLEINYKTLTIYCLDIMEFKNKNFYPIKLDTKTISRFYK